MTTRAGPRPLGTGADTFPLEFLAQVVKEGLSGLVADKVRRDDAIERHDGEASQSSVDQYTVEMKRRIVELFTRQAIRFTTSYPANSAEIPAISFVVSSDDEESDGDYPGKIIHDRTEFHGTAQTSEGDDWLTAPTGRAYRLQTRGIQQTTNVQVGIWGLPGDAFLLLRLLKQVIIKNQGRLGNAGMLSITMRTSGFAPNRETWPDIPIVPAVDLAIKYQYRFDVRQGPIPTHLRFLEIVGQN